MNSRLSHNMPTSSSSSTTARGRQLPAAGGSEQPDVRIPGQPAARQPNWMAIAADQCFLLLFIFGTYFGPDLKNEEPHKSVFHRLAEGQRPYTINELAGSQMMLSKLESVYYYVVRMAERTVIVELPLLRQFLIGCLYTPPSVVLDIRQFPNLFPPYLHNYVGVGVLQDVIENIVFINNPEMSNTRPVDVERFKRLTNLEFLFLDGDAALSFTCDRISNIPSNVLVHVNNMEVPESSLQGSQRRQAQYHIDSRDMIPMPLFYYVAPPRGILHGHMPHNSVPVSGYGPIPYTDNAMADAAFRGAMADRHLGPLMGCFNLRIGEDSYTFRLLLPIRRNCRNRLAFMVYDDGEITITGEAMPSSRMVADERRQIEMHSYYLYTPGEFNVTFYLPGPIDATQFAGAMRPDGVFEGRVTKRARR